MADTILQMTGITKVFAGVQALKDVSLRLEKGEVHALIGENGAGKSTLMKILIGIHRPEKGEIIYNGRKIEFKDTAEALKNGISMIHQEISLVQQMDVAENIWLGREADFSKGGLIDKKLRYERTRELLLELGIEIDPAANVRELSIAQMQLVELARAISYRANIIIMDEPTSALTMREIELLYAIVRKLTAEGVTVVFISHKLDEIFAICQRVTVLRDGSYVDTLPVKGLTNQKLMNLVVGRELKDMFTKHKAEMKGEALRVEHLTGSGDFYDVNFSVRSGEILGIYGLMGAGRTEIMRSIFGIDRYTSGKVFVNGREVDIKSPVDAIKLGVGMLTEDRLRLGVIYALSVVANTTIASFKRVCNRLGMFNKKRELKVFGEESDTLSIKYSSPHDLIGQLSGGNQQKVMVGRWLLTNPKILILDEPTRGIDVGAKQEIYALIDKMASAGIAVILVSSELPEILAMSDRVLVIRNGKIVFECDGKEADQVTLVSNAFGIS
ncbi:sugar ABC transporter ATP-binding protein [Christensenella intestinihominis]|uniref:sugar ABC transporter ATP-binding protein n=1 Tax=Christensenella intestinihominis TaxID=1851429 RepID=UPI000831A03C|nr:sugar ABC transporter ATP-binding protein [Christensenella intestinihominis]